MIELDREALAKQILSGSDVSVPETLQQWLDQTRALYIDGSWVQSDETFESINPATGKRLATLYLAGREEVDASVRSARKSFDRGEWCKLPMPERARWLRRIAEAIEDHRAPLAVLESLDTGKPIRESYEGDIFRAASNFSFFADLATKDGGEAFVTESALHYSLREPVGVVALITPWNLPLYLETWKIAPCLLMGNSCVLKPSELTPLTACYFAELLAELDFPPGVFNLIQGFGGNAAGEYLVSHPGVQAISFTGETVTGSAIMRSAASHLTKVSFELGGKGSTVVFADANLEQAASEAVRAGFRNQGEICLASPRLFVEAPVYDAFLESYVDQVKQIQVGSPLNYQTQMGALVGEEHYQKVTSYVESLISPARILCGGKRPESQPTGFYLEPTVADRLPEEHPVHQKEVFGPLVTAQVFRSEEEAIQKVNDTPYGLSTSVWTQNLDRAHRLVKRLQVGLCWVNCWFVRDLRVPFGGQKRSGIGREGGVHSMNFFSEWKSVCIKSSENLT